MQINRLVIITGASRGIGAAAAIGFNRRYESNTEFILLARDLNLLIETKNKMLASNNINESLIKLVRFDFSKKNLEINDYKNSLLKALDENIKSYDELIIIYNHGTLDYGLIKNANNEILQDKFQTNFFSVWLLLNAVESLFPEDLVSKQFHINLDSAFSKDPSTNWSIQCCGKIIII
jgi:short-subunit dehydrogenase